MSEATSMESNQGEVRRSATVSSMARFPTPTKITNTIHCRLNGIVILIIILATNVIAMPRRLELQELWIERESTQTWHDLSLSGDYATRHFFLLPAVEWRHSSQMLVYSALPRPPAQSKAHLAYLK